MVLFSCMYVEAAFVTWILRSDRKLQFGFQIVRHDTLVACLSTFIERSKQKYTYEYSQSVVVHE